MEAWLMACTFARIEVYAGGQRPGLDPDDITDLALWAKGGTVRLLRVDKQGRWVASDTLEVSPGGA
ncbi:hypothetical protein [Bacillus cereus]|uniref:hypothetical protein n=1 Tax=Bacillus cereus TaxID=1396 RepID=UPI00199D2A25|nr:hypothetical protein [Bacillus cereus]EFU5256967.1 hypothetical protein [Salmonella enterica]EFU5460794.1 hypothetical protein [Salmonella enterica]MEB2616659.1 hypothetical protein [Bacillus cereus]